MEITKKARFVTKFYGGRPYCQGEEIVEQWLADQTDKLAHPRYAELNKAIKSPDKLERILSVFNVNDDGHPIIGNWMLLRCSINAQKLSGTWKKYKVSADRWRSMVQFTPPFCPLVNGSRLVQPDGVDVYTVTTPKNSFFTAYQLVNSGTKFKFTIHVPDDLCEIAVKDADGNVTTEADEEQTLACVTDILDKMQIIGLGAFRERYGKFEYFE
jgi:hypothetical protein